MKVPVDHDSRPRTTYARRVLLFKVLANKGRLRIIRALSIRNMAVGELCIRTGEEESSVSHHLRCLLVCGLVSNRREGKNIVYSLNSDTVLPILGAAYRHSKKFNLTTDEHETISQARRIRTHELAI